MGVWWRPSRSYSSPPHLLWVHLPASGLLWRPDNRVMVWSLSGAGQARGVFSQSRHLLCCATLFNSDVMSCLIYTDVVHRRGEGFGCGQKEWVWIVGWEARALMDGTKSLGVTQRTWMCEHLRSFVFFVSLTNSSCYIQNFNEKT